MAFSIVSSSALAWAAGRTNSTVTAPTGIAANDILIACITLGKTGTSTPTLTAPSGFTKFAAAPLRLAQGGYVVDAYLYYKVAGSESGNYTFTHASADSEVVMTVVRGADASAPLTVTPSTSVANTQTTSVSGITTTAASSYVMFTEIVWDTVSSSLPSGTTPTFALVRKGDSILLAGGVLATAGATGTKTTGLNGNSSSANPAAAYLFALQPAGTGTPTSGTGAASGVGDAAGTGVTIIAATAQAAGAATAQAAGADATATAGTEYLTSAEPPDTYDADVQDVNLGTVFRVDATHNILGIRFHRATGAANTALANFTVSLYEVGNATALASATLAGTSVVNAAWNEVLFASPVLLDPAKNYIAAYHCPGNYTATSGFFGSAGATSPGGHIVAPQDNTVSNGATVRNGLYAYGTAPGLPNSTFGAAFYYVEPMIEVVSSGPTITVGTAAAAGVGNAAASGRSTAIATAAAAGLGSASGVGRGIAAATAMGSGTGTAAATGAARALAVANAFGLSDASGSGIWYRTLFGSTGCLSSATGDGQSIVAATASASGSASVVAAASAPGSATAQAAGSASANASGQSLADATGASSASSVVQGSGNALIPATGAASGTAAVSGNGLGVITRAGSGSSTSVAVAAATGRSIVVATAQASGTSPVTGRAIVTLTGVGSAAGTSVADGRAGSSTLITATAASAGAATAAASATATAQATAQAGGQAGATGSSASSAIVSAVAQAAGSSTGSGTARKIVVTRAASAGAATAGGVSLTLMFVTATAQASGSAVALARAQAPAAGRPLPGFAHAVALFGRRSLTRLTGQASRTTLKDH